jgi:hypothetical protein
MLPELPRVLKSDPQVDSAEEISQGGAACPTPGDATPAEHHSQICPTCGHRLTGYRCKLICAYCGYYLSCADYY